MNPLRSYLLRRRLHQLMPKRRDPLFRVLLVARHYSRKPLFLVPVERPRGPSVVKAAEIAIMRRPTAYARAR